MPPFEIVKVAADKPPPMRFCPSDNCPMVPDSPPEAVSPNEQVDRGRAREDTPATKEKIIVACIIASVITLNESTR